MLRLTLTGGWFFTESASVTKTPAQGAIVATGLAPSVISGPPQFAYPVADIAMGGWLPSSGGVLYAMLNESPPPNAGTYIYSPPNPTTEQFEVTLGEISDPGTTAGQSVAIAMVAENLDTSFDFNLVEGTTVLDSWTESVTAAEGHVTRERIFATSVIAQITNRADVRIRGVARAP